MKVLSMLVIGAVVFSSARADEISFYGLKLSTGGPRVAGVTKVTVSDFPWLTTKSIETQDDLDGLIKRAARREDGSQRPTKPAIFYVSSQPAESSATTIARMDHFYFFQQDVKDRLDEYRWYWAYVDTTAGRLLLKSHKIEEKTALLIFEEDGSVLHIEAPITGPKSVARAMRMIADKRQMEAAVKADLPLLREEFRAGNYKELVTYLLRTDKHEMYSTPWTRDKLAAMRRAVNHQGEVNIKRAEELAAEGDRGTALKILAEVRRAFDPFPPSTQANEVAKKIRSRRS